MDWVRYAGWSGNPLGRGHAIEQGKEQDRRVEWFTADRDDDAEFFFFELIPALLLQSRCFVTTRGV